MTSTAKHRTLRKHTGQARSKALPKHTGGANQVGDARWLRLEPDAADQVARRAAQAPQAQLPTRAQQAPSGDEWVHEIELDGHRLLARIAAGEISLFTKTGEDWSERLPTIRAALAELALPNAVLDGELVALDAKGVSDLTALERELREGADTSLIYYAFDLLHDGRDLADLPLLERKSRLRQALSSAAQQLAGRVRFSAHVVGHGPAFFENACKLGLSGTVAKRACSKYQGGRSTDWLLIRRPPVGFRREPAPNSPTFPKSHSPGSASSVNPSNPKE